MKRRIRKLGMACGAIVLSAMICFAGCASGEVQDTASPEPTEEATETPTPEPTEEMSATLEPRTEPSYVTFGTESQEAYTVVLTNGTGQDITELKVRNSDDPEFGENMIPAGTTITADETFRLYIPKEIAAAATEGVSASNAAAEEASAEESVPGEKDERNIKFNETYDIQLTFADGREATLYDLGLEDIDTALIAYSAEENVAYVSYVSTATNETVSTLDAQIARSRDEAAAALEEAGTQTDADAPAANEGTSVSQNTTNEATGGNNEVSDGGASNDGGTAVSEVEEEPADDGGYDEPVYEENEPEQDIGACIEDNVIWND